MSNGPVSWGGARCCVRASGSFLTTIPAVGGGFLTSSYSLRITDNVLRVGVNYKFGGPVVAKY
jgi:outer membrane immunogenic protein